MQGTCALILVTRNPFFGSRRKLYFHLGYHCILALGGTHYLELITRALVLDLWRERTTEFLRGEIESPLKDLFRGDETCASSITVTAPVRLRR
ncbi:hypothetical protein YC2023_049091 [Brassica napus]